jgi:putative FmdB family regulatory protein
LHSETIFSIVTTSCTRADASRSRYPRAYTQQPVPIYEYRCTKGHTFEVSQPINDDPLTKCQVCGNPVERVLHSPAVHFKGSGFYNTDYGTKKRQREQKSSEREQKSSEREQKSSASESSSSSSESSSSSDSSSSSGEEKKKSESKSSTDKAKPASSS